MTTKTDTTGNSYTTLEFNALPGWARDHILELEKAAGDALPLLEAHYRNSTEGAPTIIRLRSLLKQWEG